MRTVTIEPRWAAFRGAARTLLAQGLVPEQIVWRESDAPEDQLALLDVASPLQVRADHPGVRPAVPRRYLTLGEQTACHREPPAWTHLYHVLWRLTNGERALLDDAADPDVAALGDMARAVRRDAHKMKAFVRFRTVCDDAGERYVAWFEPKHRIVRFVAPFFERRFPSMRWSILTPDECVHWDGGELRFSPGVAPVDAPAADAFEAAWLTYYASTFNPARVRVRAMRAEMPVYYWNNLPEVAQIPELLRAAPGRVREMVERLGAGDPVGNRNRAAPEDQQYGSGIARDERATTGRLQEAQRSDVRMAARTRQPPLRTMPRIPRVRIGVAGWDYPDWADRIYPSARAGVDRLRWVAERFDLIEVNSTFYRPVARRAAESWLARTADLEDFRFSAKLLRAFTHGDEPWSDIDARAVLDGMRPLHDAGRLVSLVVQFPWSFREGAASRVRVERIAATFAELPLHVEVRHASWLAPDVEPWLAALNVGVVNIDQPMFADSVPPRASMTSATGYVRLHGRNRNAWFRPDAGRDERYDYSYPRPELEPWGERVRSMLAGDADEIAVVFNNHYRGQAVDNAETFGRLLAQEFAAAPSSA